MSKELAKQLEKEILIFLKKAGEFAIEKRENALSKIKEDGTLVTDIDFAISEMINNDFSKYFESDEHVLIDEEITSRKNLPSDILKNKPKYLWAVDPIDGTSPFSNNLPLWGISIGIFKELKPWLGFIYQPDINTLFIHNGEEFYRIKNAFSNNEKKTTFEKRNIQPKGTKFIVITPSVKIDFPQTHEYCTKLLPYTAVCTFTWTAIGGIFGHLMPKHNFGGVWDWAAAWPMLKHTKNDFRKASNGEVIESLEDILDTNWKGKDNYIISSAENFKFLQKNSKFK